MEPSDKKELNPYFISMIRGISSMNVTAIGVLWYLHKEKYLTPIYLTEILWDQKSFEKIANEALSWVKEEFKKQGEEELTKRTWMWFAEDGRTIVKEVAEKINEAFVLKEKAFVQQDTPTLILQ